MYMKTRVTITLDPRVIRRAKSVARSRQTNLSALIEDLLNHAANYSTTRSIRFTQKWAGQFTARMSDGSDPLLDAMKSRYDIQ
jgi:hypothetical protein